MWQNEIRGQNPACVPDNVAVFCFMQHLNQHQSVGQQITNGPFEKGLTGNTTRSLWIALDTLKELENCLKKLDRRVSRKRRNLVTQQKAEVNHLELRSQLGRMREKLPLEYFETRLGYPHLPNSWWRTLSPGLRVSFCSGSAWLKLHRKIWTHVTKWNTGTKACTCTGWWCSMLLHVALESIPERRSTNLNWSSWGGFHEKHCLFLTDSPGYDERAR